MGLEDALKKQIADLEAAGDIQGLENVKMEAELEMRGETISVVEDAINRAKEKKQELDKTQEAVSHHDLLEKQVADMGGEIPEEVGKIDAKIESVSLNAKQEASEVEKGVVENPEAKEILEALDTLIASYESGNNSSAIQIHSWLEKAKTKGIPVDQERIKAVLDSAISKGDLGKEYSFEKINTYIEHRGLGRELYKAAESGDTAMFEEVAQRYNANIQELGMQDSLVDNLRSGLSRGDAQSPQEQSLASKIEKENIQKLEKDIESLRKWGEFFKNNPIGNETVARSPEANVPVLVERTQKLKALLAEYIPLVHKYRSAEDRGSSDSRYQQLSDELNKMAGYQDTYLGNNQHEPRLAKSWNMTSDGKLAHGFVYMDNLPLVFPDSPIALSNLIELSLKDKEEELRKNRENLAASS